MRILALESSCDESAAAVFDGERGLLAHEVFSQVDLHQIYGGVVPELASRDHVQRLLPIVERVLERAGCFGASNVEGIAYTAGPGLIGALLTGAALARSLASAWGVPSIGVHHLEGHLLAPLLEPDPPQFPHVALLVSGGHTMLIECGGIGEYTLLGETRDDAAGEAFDKMIKQRKEAVTQFEAGGRTDLAAKETTEIELLQAYLPEQLSQADLEKLIAEAIRETGAASVKDMGKVMGLVKTRAAGRADMGAVSALIKSKLGTS